MEVDINRQNLKSVEFYKLLEYFHILHLQCFVSFSCISHFSVSLLSLVVGKRKEQQSCQRMRIKRGDQLSAVCSCIEMSFRYEYGTSVLVLIPICRCSIALDAHLELLNTIICRSSSEQAFPQLFIC